MTNKHEHGNGLGATPYAGVPPQSAEAALYLLPGQYLFQWLDGREQTFKFISPAAVRQAFSKEPVDSGWLPAGCVKWGAAPAGVFMVGYYEPSLRQFSVEFENNTKVWHETFRVPMPALVYAGVGDKYYVWAMRGGKFDPSGALYHAPLPNINAHGLICFGSNRHPHVAGGGFQRSWETFWRAPFSGDHSEGKSRSAKADVREQLKRLHKARAKAYPAADLIPMKTTLEKAVDRLTNRGER